MKKFLFAAAVAASMAALSAPVCAQSAREYGYGGMGNNVMTANSAAEGVVVTMRQVRIKSQNTHIAEAGAGAVVGNLLAIAAGGDPVARGLASIAGGWAGNKIGQSNESYDVAQEVLVKLAGTGKVLAITQAETDAEIHPGAKVWVIYSSTERSVRVAPYGDTQ